MKERNIKDLDLILNKLVQADGVISINDFQDENGNYFGFKESEEAENYFKDLMSVFEELNIANVKLNFLELIPVGSEHRTFKNKGGFSKHYERKEDTPSKGEKTTKNVTYNISGNVEQLNQDSNFSNSPISIKTKPAPNKKPVIKSRLNKFFSNKWLIGISLVVLAAILNGNRIMNVINKFLDNL